MGEGRTDTGSNSGTPSENIQPSSRDETYTVTEAAKVLKLTDRRVRALAQEGRIEGDRTESGWKLFRWSVHSFRDERRERSGPPEAVRSSVEAREEQQRVEALQRELGRLEGRLELEAVARSTLEETLQRERERADRLEAELAEARKGFWARWFGS